MINWLHKTPLIRKLRVAIAKKIRYYRIAFTFYFDYRKELYDKLLAIHESPIWQGGSVSEAYNLYTLTERTNKLEGDIAEVGVGQGGHSTVICEAKGSRNLHLFDSFNGFVGQDVNREEMKYIEDNCEETYESHATDVNQVRKHFKQYPNVFIYQGWFPKTAAPIYDKKFSFVNLDVNFYKSQMDCLEFFYPRMVRGGIIITHDYTLLPEVRRAFDEFFKDKLEIVVELHGTHAMIVRV